MVEIENQKIKISELLKKGILLMVISIIGNIIIYLLGDILNAYPDGFEVPVGPFNTQVVVLVTILFELPALIGYYVLRNILNLSLQRIRILGIIALVISFSFPLSISGINTLTIMIFELFHLFSGITMIYGLTNEKTS